MATQILCTSLPLPLVEDERSDVPLGVAWSSNGYHLAIARQYQPIRLWDPLKGMLRKVLQQADSSSARELVFSPDSSRLASVLADGRVQVWCCNTGELVPVVSDPNFDLSALCWSPDRCCLAVARQRNIEMWESYSGGPSRRKDAKCDVDVLAWSKTGEFLATGGNGVVKIWRPDLTQQSTHQLEDPNQVNGIIGLAWSIECDRLFVAGWSGRIEVLNIAHNKVERSLVEHGKSVIHLAVSADGAILASKSLDQTVCFWDLRDWSLIGKESESALISQFPVLAFHPTLPILASADPVNDVVRIRTFDLEKKTDKLPPLEIFFSYSHDDNRLCTRLIEHLDSLQQSGRILCWSDHRLVPGETWRSTILDHIGSCALAVCLVSAKFISSKPCQGEVSTLLQRREEGSLRVLSVVLRPVPFETSPLFDFQAGPVDKDNRLKPISSWGTSEEGLAEAARWIIRAIDELRAQKTIPIPGRDLAPFGRKIDLSSRPGR